MSPKIIKKGTFDTSKIQTFDEELTPKKIATGDQKLKTHKFEKNIHHAKKVAVFQDAQNEARDILEKARRDALNEAEKIKKDAFQKGYHDGMSKAVTEGKTYVADAVKSFSGLIKEITEYKRNLIEDAEHQLLLLSVKIAEKIISIKISENDEVILNVVTQAVKNLIDREVLTIRLNPKDVEVMKREKVNLMQELDGIKKLTIIEDENILRGGAYIETESSEIDARIDKQLNIMQKTLERK